MIAVVLSTPHKFHLSSWLIKYGTRFDSSHAAICVMGEGWMKDQALVLESTSHGTTFVHAGVWDTNNKPMHILLLKEHEDVAKAALGRLLPKLGSGYDYKGAYGYGIRLLIYAWTGKLLRAQDTPDKMFCSELVARWVNDIRLETGVERLALLPDETTPAALYYQLKGSAWFEEVSCASSLSATFT